MREQRGSVVIGQRNKCCCSRVFTVFTLYSSESEKILIIKSVNGGPFVQLYMATSMLLSWTTLYSHRTFFFRLFISILDLLFNLWKSAVHHSEEVRMKAIRLVFHTQLASFFTPFSLSLSPNKPMWASFASNFLSAYNVPWYPFPQVANKLYPLPSITQNIEDFAKESLLSVIDSGPGGTQCSDETDAERSTSEAQKVVFYVPFEDIPVSKLAIINISRWEHNEYQN